MVISLATATRESHDFNRGRCQKELDYENNSELGVGVKTFAAGSTTTIGKMKGHKLIYNIGMNLSNGKLGVNSYSIDTLDVTNEVHKWLADHGYTRTD